MKARSRFENHGITTDPASILSLSKSHPAMVEQRTIFPSTVVSSLHAPRILGKGTNQKKLGDRVIKGAWKGMPIYALTLEERKTCPRSCHLLSTCYGNGMPLSRRIAFDSALVPALDLELAQLQAIHPRGFVVRLHILGDFPNVAYVRQWEAWLGDFPALRVFGYTAHAPATRVGEEIARVGKRLWHRFAIRHSVRPSTPIAAAQATTVARLPAERSSAVGIVCPVQTSAARNCGSCGLCWAPAARDKRIIFVLHGQPKTRSGPTAAGASRSKAVLRMAIEAAESGKPMPTNQVLCDTLGFKKLGHASMALKVWERKGDIRVERFQTGRIVTVVASGKRTAAPKDMTPHWRDR